MQDAPVFPTDFKSILDRVEAVDPVRYARSRNHIDGAVTLLSPYVSRGVISTRMVMESLFRRGYRRHQMEKLLQELAWRDFFQRVAQAEPELCAEDLRQPQQGVVSEGMPRAVVEARTGITAIDDAIRGLYRSGYMHNHCRMYVAALTCNIARSGWRLPASWMYHHLLDADFASNACSWQWVAGSFSGKRYLANQENINRYCHTVQAGTFLDAGYERLAGMPVPEVLSARVWPALEAVLPRTPPLALRPGLPLLVYNIYNLDPLWRAAEDANRVLLLEPSHFRRHPVAAPVIDFCLSLAENIPGVMVHAGEFEGLSAMSPGAPVRFKEHPLFRHYRGEADPRDWMFPEAAAGRGGFFGYWKRCERFLKDL